MADMMSKHAFGKKDGIEAAKQAGKLDEFDILFLDNGETGWIDKNGNTVISTPRTQAPIVVNGATNLGVADGTTIPAGQTFDDIVKMLAQRSIPAKYAAPVVKLSNNGGTVAGEVEAGSTISPKLLSTFVKNDAGALEKLTLSMDGVELGTSVENSLSYNGDSITIGDETVIFKATAKHDEGQIKADNLGNASPNGHIEAGTIASNIYTFVGKRKIFYGAGTGNLTAFSSDSIRTLGNSILAPKQGQKITFTAVKGSQYIVFAVPEELEVARISYDEMGDGSMLSSFSKETVQVADARGGANSLKNYTCYSYKLKVPATVPLTFTFTIA